jgi:hypothetical protein
MNNAELDALVTRLYRAAMSITDIGWQELLKNAACSLSAAQEPAALIAAVALTDTVLVLAEHGRHVDRQLTASLRQGLRGVLSRPSAPARQVDSSAAEAAR